MSVNTYSILCFMKRHVDIHVIHALSLKMNLILLACIVALLSRTRTTQLQLNNMEQNINFIST